MQKTLVVFTDGGCSGNPGPGGWAFVITEGGMEIVAKSGGEVQTTNNRMELTAVIEALRHILSQPGEVASVQINTDSQYVKNGITQWIHNWKRNGWRTASKDPVKNKEYWIALDELSAKVQIQWQWVKGHAGIELNERCDALVRQEMDAILNR
jgi:ribonuclease HI